MHLFPAFIVALMLGACSIQNDVPDFVYPDEMDTSDKDWPELGVTSELEAAGAKVQRDAVQKQRGNDHLAARARALKEQLTRSKKQLEN